MTGIDVIIPVYNVEMYLEFCVNSILNQTYKDIQIILIDDGASDDSSNICDELASKCPNIIVIHKHNKGASDARNIGLKVSTKSYIHFVDSDDFVEDNGIYTLIKEKILKENTEIVFSRRVRYNGDLSKKQAVQPEYISSSDFQGDVLKEVLQKQYVLTLTCPVNKIFNREFLIKNNLFFTVGLDHEEDEWLPRVIANASNVCFCNDILYGVRYRETGSLSAMPNEATRVRKAKSKIRIAVSGMEYMLRKNLSKETLQYVTEYYWGYMLDAVVAANRVSDKNLKKEVLDFLKQHKSFFANKKYLKNKSWRLQGWLFQFMGIGFTAKLLAKRYGK